MTLRTVTLMPCGVIAGGDSVQPFYCGAHPTAASTAEGWAEHLNDIVAHPGLADRIHTAEGDSIIAEMVD